jgi:hypothetical protein
MKRTVLMVIALLVVAALSHGQKVYENNYLVKVGDSP